MKIISKRGKWSPKEVEALIVPVLMNEGFVKGVPKEVQELLGQAAQQKRFQGKKNQILALDLAAENVGGLRRLIFLGLGKKGSLNLHDLDELLGRAIRQTQAGNINKAGFWFRSILADYREEGLANMAESLAEAATLSSYEFNRYLKTKKPLLKSLTFFVESSGDFSLIKTEAQKGNMIAAIINESRDICNMPSNHMRPRDLADFAKAKAKQHAKLSVKVLGEKEMAKLGMGGVLARLKRPSLSSPNIGEPKKNKRLMWLWEKVSLLTRVVCR